MKTLYVYVEDQELRNKYACMNETRNGDSGV